VSENKDMTKYTQCCISAICITPKGA